MSDSLKNKFLFYSPTEYEEKDYFANALIYMCENNDEGSLGLIINRSIDVQMVDNFLDLKEKNHLNQKIALGGPVESTSIFVLHTIDKDNKPDVRVTNEIGFSSNKQVIENILKGKFPDKFIVSFGYTGWGPNQLENEIAQNAWEITDAHQEIVFDTPNNLKLNKLTEVSGFDPRIINQTQGSS